MEDNALIDEKLSSWPRIICQARRLSENALFSRLCVILKRLPSEYQPHTYGNFFSKPTSKEGIYQ